MKRCALILTLLALASTSFAVWPTAVRLTDGPNENINPDIFVVDQPVPWDSLILVWQRSRPGGWDIYSRRNGGGSTWSAPQLVSSLPDSNLTPSVAACNPIRYCVWVNCHGDSQNILCSRWTNGTWATPVYLTQDTFQNAEPTVRCPYYIDSVAVAWASFRNGHWNLYSRFYNGTSWSPIIPVIQDSGNNRLPHLGSYWNRSNRRLLYLAWQNEDVGNRNIWISRFVGGVWTAPQRITHGSQTDHQPSTVKGFSANSYDLVDILWSSDSLGNFEIIGANPDSSARERFTSHDSSDSEPSALDHSCFSGQQTALSHPILTAWTSHRDGNPNIYAELRLIGQERVDSSPAEDRHPTVSAILSLNGWYFYEWVIWQSNRDGNWNLYGSYQMISSGGVESGDPEIGSKGETTMISPVPFRPPGRMTLFYPGSRSDIAFRFYDLQGRVVGLCRAEKKAPGQYELSWDGRNQQGHALPSGLYFLKPEGTSALYRIVLLR